MAMDWYVLRIRSEKEESIKASLEGRIRAAGVDQHFGRILIPTELQSEIRDGKKKISEAKLYPGYLMIEMDFNDDSWFVVSETPGISGFVGGDRRQRILDDIEARKEKPKPKVEFDIGDKVKVKEGPFENYDGEVLEVNATKGRLTVQVNIFRRSTTVDLEFWKVERV